MKEALIKFLHDESSQHPETDEKKKMMSDESTGTSEPCEKEKAAQILATYKKFIETRLIAEPSDDVVLLIPSGRESILAESRNYKLIVGESAAQDMVTFLTSWIRSPEHAPPKDLNGKPVDLTSDAACKDFFRQRWLRELRDQDFAPGEFEPVHALITPQMESVINRALVKFREWAAPTHEEN